MANSNDGQDRHRGQLSPEDKALFERRISDLGKKLGKARTERADNKRGHEGSATRGQGMAQGLKMGSELVGAVLVGAAIGYGLDMLLGTKPWLSLLFFLLGFAAGVLNVVRGYNRLQTDITRETGGNIGKDLPDGDDD